MKKLFVTMVALLAVGFASAQGEIVTKFNEGGALFDERDPRYEKAAAEAKKAKILTWTGSKLVS